MQPALPLVKPVEPRTLGVAAIILSGAMLSSMTQQYRDLSFPVLSAVITKDEVVKNSCISENIPESTNDLIPTKSFAAMSIMTVTDKLKIDLTDLSETPVTNNSAKDNDLNLIQEDNRLSIVQEVEKLNKDVNQIKSSPDLDSSERYSEQALHTENSAELTIPNDHELKTNTDPDESFNYDNETDLKKNIISYALSWEGVPYRWGGESRNGIDCSALVQNVYKKYGIALPRTSREQFRMGVGIPKNKLTPGDLVFFSTNGPGASHVGIYLGEGNFLSATRRQVEKESLDDPYWQKYYRGSRRILD